MAQIKKDTQKFETLVSAFCNGSKIAARKVVRVLKNLQLPVPENANELLAGTEGALLFSNDHGIVVRIERKNPEKRMNIQRINDNPWILQPLATYEAGNLLVEICPGVSNIKTRGEFEALRECVKETGVNFWDCHGANAGTLPFTTPSFPHGVPVIIDRTGVEGLTASVEKIKEALKTIGVSEDPQRELYAPLRKALKDAWPDTKAKADGKKMLDFWSLCSAFNAQGKLVTGWNMWPNPSKKTCGAQDAAKTYTHKIRAYHAGKRNG